MSHFSHYVILPIKLAQSAPNALPAGSIPEPATEDVPIARASRWSLAVQDRPTWQALTREAPPDDEVNAALERLMAPFSEELRVPEYDTACWCLNSAASRRTGFLVESDWPRCERQAARIRLLERAGVPHYSSTEFEELFKNEECFTAYQEQVHEAEEPIDTFWHTLWNSFEAIQPDRNQPKPDCSTCHGSGIETTSYNPVTYREVWQIDDASSKVARAVELTGYEILPGLPPELANRALLQGAEVDSPQQGRALLVLRFVRDGAEQRAEPNDRTAPPGTPQKVRADGVAVSGDTDAAGGQVRDLPPATDEPLAGSGSQPSDESGEGPAVQPLQLGARTVGERARLPLAGASVPGVLLDRRCVGGSKWDWWVVGGRWNGAIMDQPRDDTGGGFNFGDEFHQLAENMAVAGELAGRDDTRWVPFSILTPEGEWIEKGKMLLFGVAVDQKPKNDWRQQARTIMQRYADHWVVGCDCHI